MSDNSYHTAKTQELFAVDYDFALTYQGGATGPLLGEGDPNGAYIKAQWGSSGITGVTGATGTTVVTTVDPFPGCITAIAVPAIVGQGGGGWTIEFGIPVQNVDNTWSVPFTAFNSGTPTDLPQGSQVFCHFRFRNGPQNT